MSMHATFMLMNMHMNGHEHYHSCCSDNHAMNMSIIINAVVALMYATTFMDINAELI